MIRKACINDIEAIMIIYQKAKKFMRETGNPNQWNSNYPQKELLLNDIKSENSYLVCDQSNTPHAVFYFSLGEDPTYKVIKEGTWLNDKPYGVIHRIASDGVLHGVLKECVNYCRVFSSELRVDTHHDNKVMQCALEKIGFSRCGIINLLNGDERIAYHLSL